MKLLNIFLGILLGLTIISCASDDTPENNSRKKITQITYSYPNGQIRLTEKFIYDANDNLKEVINANGLILRSFSYDNLNFLIKVIDYHYNDNQFLYEVIKKISYNSNNKIDNIEELFNVYDSNGNFDHQYSRNKNIIYGNNTIKSISDGIDNNTVEFTISDNLITRAKIFYGNNLIADMIFTYDSEGNCISGNGPYKPGLYDTNNIDLNVTYGDKEKKPFFNTFFDFNVLFYNDSFFYLKEVLVNQQGTKYAERIQWYQYENWNYRDYNDYSFDIDGYVISKKTNFHNTNTFAEITTYYWE